jgi:parvulin-like peptidyl-prolyl isomerase
VVLSAGPGQAALDRLASDDAHPNGVFTRVLVPLLRSDLPLLAAARRAQEEVAALAASVGHEQRPSYYGEAQGATCLSGACANPGEEIQIAKFAPKEERRVRHILVETEAKARAIIDELESGGDFAELAIARSTDSGSAPLGGDLGYFTRGQMVLPFEEAAFSIAVGEFGHTPVETVFGWHVIKVVDARRQARLSLEEALEQGPRRSMRDAAQRVEKLGPRVQP